MKIKRFCEIFIQISLAILLLGMFIFNIIKFNLDNSNIFLYSFVLFLLFLAFLWLYKKKFISKKVLFIFNLLLLIIGIAIRIFLIKNIHFVLSSDFEFVYENAKDIITNSLKNTNYLAYNGYSYLYSSFLVIIFKIFGFGVSPINGLYSVTIFELNK